MQWLYIICYDQWDYDYDTHAVNYLVICCHKDICGGRN